MQRVFFIAGIAGGVGRFLGAELRRRNRIVVGADLPQALEAQVDGVAVGETLQRQGVHVIPADLSSGQVCIDLVNRVVAEHGDLHEVLCLTGRNADRFWLKKPAELWQEVVNSHIDPFYALTRAAGLYWNSLTLEPEDHRTFIGVSSVNAKRQCDGQSDYAAAKAMIEAETWQLGGEWLMFFGPRVSLVTIAFGYIDGGMALKIDPGIREDLEAINGFIQLNEVADAICWILDKAAFLNGVTIPFYANAHYLERRAYADLCRKRRKDREATAKAAAVVTTGNGNGNGDGHPVLATPANAQS